MIDPKAVGFDQFLRRRVANIVHESQSGLRESDLGPGRNVALPEYGDRFPTISPTVIESGITAALVAGKVIGLNGGETLVTSVTTPTGAGSAHTHSLSGSTGAGSAHTHSLSGSTATGSSHTHTLSGSTGTGSAHSHSVSDSGHTHGFSPSTIIIYPDSLGYYRTTDQGQGSYTVVTGASIVGAVTGVGVLTEGSHTHSVGTLAAANESSHTHGVGTLAAANESSHTHGVGTLAAANESAHTHAIVSASATKYYVSYTP